MGNDSKQSYYAILDISFNASPEIIRTSYIRAKNAYNRDSLATYSLFDREESKKVLEEIEEAYTVLSDSDKRRKYDESHGIVSSESVYDAYHRGNHAVAAFARDSEEDADRFSFENDPFRKANKPAAPQTAAENSALERLKALQNLSQNTANPKSYQVSHSYEANAEMDERIRLCQNVNGAFLREVREYKKISPDEVMNLLKISRNYLTALEADDYAKLPANVFVRGFVIQYAKALKIDAEKAAASYMELLRAKRP